MKGMVSAYASHDPAPADPATDALSTQEAWCAFLVVEIYTHACSLQASMCVTNGIPLGYSLLLPVDTV
jgi:hypothetical protein